jgi:hypothetical protein
VTPQITSLSVTWTEPASDIAVSSYDLTYSPDPFSTSFRVALTDTQYCHTRWFQLRSVWQVGWTGGRKWFWVTLSSCPQLEPTVSFFGINPSPYCRSSVVESVTVDPCWEWPPASLPTPSFMCSDAYDCCAFQEQPHADWPPCQHLLPFVGYSYFTGRFVLWPIYLAVQMEYVNRKLLCT